MVEEAEEIGKRSGKHTRRRSGIRTKELLKSESVPVFAGTGASTVAQL